MKKNVKTLELTGLKYKYNYEHDTNYAKLYFLNFPTEDFNDSN